MPAGAEFLGGGGPGSLNYQQSWSSPAWKTAWEAGFQGAGAGELDLVSILEPEFIA